MNRLSSLDQIEARIRDCATYNFGTVNADKLAHEDAPALLARVRELEEVLAGADHTAAKYWQRMREAEVAAGVAEDRVKRAQAEALREAHADIQAYTDSGAPFGYRPVEEFLLQHADRIENEGAGE